jgi:UDP-glucuronate 4-epimerase
MYVHSTVLVTGSALTLRLLERGDMVIGIDNHNNYFDPAIKEARLAQYANHHNYTHLRIDLADRQAIEPPLPATSPSEWPTLLHRPGCATQLTNR